MPLKIGTNVLRGPGRPKRHAAPAPAAVPVANVTPAKRGRPAKADAADVAAEPPKKRGRPAKVKNNEATEVPSPAPTPRTRGRRGQEEKEGEEGAAISEVPTPKKRVGRPRKEEVVVVPHALTTTPRRGRPAKTAAPALHRLPASLRITKQSSPRSRMPAKAAVTPAPRLDPRVRSKLRTRVPATKKSVKEEPVAQQSAKRGRPRKTHVEAADSKKKEPVVKPAKPSVPRKRRGYTQIEVEDRFATLVHQYYQALRDGEDSESVPPEQELLDEDDIDVATEKHNIIIGATPAGDDHVNDQLISDQDLDHDQEESGHDSTNGVESDNQEEVIAENVQVVAAQDEQLDGETPEVTIQLTLQEVVQTQHIEYHGDGDYEQEIDAEVDIYEQSSSEPLPASAEEDDAESFIRGYSNPSTTVIFG